VSPEEKAQYIATQEKVFRDAVRWLFEAERFNTNYSGDNWRDDGLGEISDIAKNTHIEAIRAVIRARAELRKARAQ
jgi:hypothetical protein